ncbi:multidrug effflux MFS transporter [Oceanibacterium hippocampi]|uniref:Bcr/CflA family efflux transporter n=1 Tax=Oceanibacterium hippocampi TaxID=745714 RepID=A0A1Y5S3V8_9PROT|nr:multidrug effflux MFS transporter [Oceanibacterium hippocampi]SLN32050.1 Bicyclomycin resistance protein [Oceanibacterium hippocampi]
MSTRRIPPLYVLVLATMTGPLALNIIVPSMPGMAREFDVDFETIQFTLTFYLIGVAFGQLIYGPLSDRFGRRPLILIGAALFTAASLVTAFADSANWVIVGRIVQALGACSGMVLTRAIVRDIYSRERSASMLGYIMMAMAVAPATAPAIGGYIDAWVGWRASFVLVGGLGLVVFVACLTQLSETNLKRNETLDLLGQFRSFGKLLRSPAYVGYTGCAAFTVGAFFAFLSTGPYYIIEVLGAGSEQYGIWFIIISVGYIAGNLVVGRFSVRYGGDRVVFLGSAASVVGGLALIYGAVVETTSLAAIFLPMCLVTFGNGSSQPIAIAAAISEAPHMAGAASGLIGFSQMVVSLLVTVTIGQLLTDSAWPLVISVSGAGLLSFGCYFWAYSVNRRNRGT